MFKATTLAAAAIASATAFAAPTLTVGYSDIDSGDLSAKLTWEGSGQVTVQRAESASGPWSDKGTASSGSWTDSSTVVSKTYWYRLNDGSSTSDAVKFAAVRKLNTDGYAIFSDGKSGNIANAFDGSVDTRPSGESVALSRVGVDFGAATNHIALVRFYPRKDWYSIRLSFLGLYGSATPTSAGVQVSDGVLGEVDGFDSNNPDNTSMFRWYALDVDSTVAYSCYYAYKTGEEGEGDRSGFFASVSEIEFYGWTAEDVANAGGDDPSGGEGGEGGGNPPSGDADVSGANLTAAANADDDFTAKLAWNALSGSATLQASLGPNGPWTSIAEIGASVTSYVDESAPYGLVRYYRLASANSASGVVSFKRLRRFTPEDGTVFWSGTCGETWYKPGSNSFDGNTTTFADLDGNPAKVGIDFGGTMPFIALARVHTRPQEYSNRANGARVYGSSRTGETLSNSAASDLDTSLSLALSGIGSPVDAWFTLDVDSATAYRSYYLAVENGNLSEIQFYGWKAEDVVIPGIAAPAVESVEADPDAATITVEWSCDATASIDSFILERKAGSGAWTELARFDANVDSYVDEDPATKQTYSYRVSAVFANGIVMTSESSAGVYYKKTVPNVALTIPEIENVVVKSVKADGDTIGGENGVYMIPQGSEVVVTFLPVEGYILNRTTMTFTVDEAMTLPLDGRPVPAEGVPLSITEVMAANETTLATHDGATEIDWIEIHNAGGTDLDIAGWLMTDDPTKKISKWKPIEGPAVVPAGGYLVVFADNVKTEWSEFDAHVALGLSSGGEAAALASPDGTIVSQLYFGQQFDDVSFGVGHVERELVRSTRAAEYRIGDGAWKACDGAIGMATVSGGFKVDVYRAQNCSPNTVELAKQIVGDPDSWSWAHSSEVRQTLAYFHAYQGTHTTFAPYADFPVPDWDGNNIAVHATAVINIPEPGYWTFSMYGDDAFEYTISGHGARFTKAGGGWDSQTVDAYYFNVAGDYDVEIYLAQQGGDAGIDFSVAKGELDKFSTDNFHLVGATSSGVLHSGSIASKIYTRVDSEMLGKADNASWRKSFTLDTLPDDGEIQLRICYADGFEASINNHVFRSVAVASRTDEEILAPSYFNIPVEHLNVGENTIEVVGYNNDVNDQTFLIAPDVILNTESGLVYFTTPTPGRENASDGKTGMTPKIVFSEPHGYKTESFQLSLSCPEDDGVKIYYTLNGASPTTDDFLYTGPITVSKTTVVRAAAADEKSVFQQDTSATYIFLEDVLSAKQGYDWENVPAGWPSNGSMRPDGSQYGASMFYGMNQALVASERARIEKGFTNSAHVATISMVVNLADLFDNSMGIWANAGQHGSDWERPAMIEQIDPVTGEANEFSVSCGIRMRGGMSRGLNVEKHGFRLFFRSEYGMSRLEFPLFGEDGASSFKKIDLRCDQNHSFARGKKQADDDNVSGMYDTLVHEVFNRDTQLDMNQPAARSRYYHLFINGVYYGVYQTEERCEDEFSETYLGGSAENYDVIKTSSTYSYADNSAHYTTGANEGTIDAWSNLWHVATKEGFGQNHSENYNKVQGLNPDGTRNPDYPILLNRKNLQDYVIETHYAADCDSPGSVFGGHANNIIAIRNRIDGESSKDGFIFYRHDSEYTLGIHDYGAFGGWNTYNANHVSAYGTSYTATGNGNAVFATLENFTPSELHYRLMDDPEYKMAFADRVYKRCFKNGVLTAENARARFERRMAEVEDAVSCEIARWAHRDQTHTTWENACNYCLDFIDKRVPYLIADYQERGWYPSVAAPVVKTDGGVELYDEDVLPEGSSIRLDGDGDIYYVTDGSDPRAEGGALAANAIKYDGNAIAIPATGYKIRARILKNGEWSPLENVNVNSEADDASVLAQYLRFHSFCGTPAVEGGDEGEWIAVTNLSSEVELDLGGLVILVKKDADPKEEAKCVFTIQDGTKLPADGYLRFDQAEYGWNKITNNKIDMYILQKDGETEIQKAHATQKDFPTVYGNVNEVGGKGGGAYLIAISFETEIDKTCWIASPLEIPDLPALSDGTVVGTVEGTVATIDASLAPAGTEVFIPEGVTEVHISVKDSDSASVDTTSCYTSASLVPAGGKIVPALDESVVRPAFTESALGMKDAIKVGASTVELTASAKPGLFYTLKSSSSVRGEYAAVEKRQAASGDNFVAFSVQRPAGVSAFYVVEVTDR